MMRAPLIFRKTSASAPAWRAMLAAGVAWVAVFPSCGPAADAPPAAARSEIEAAPVSVKGLGWWKNRNARKSLRLLEPEDGPLATINAIYIEDAALVLDAEMQDGGYLRASGVAEVMRDGKPVGIYPWKAGELPQPPREMAGDGVVFRLQRGVRFTIESLDFDGLTDVERGEAEAFFVSKGLLLEGSSGRLFTPERLGSGVANLRESLRHRGYADARVSVAELARDDETGAVRVAIAVEKGAVHRVEEVELPPDLPDEVVAELTAICAGAAGVDYSTWWEQDLQQSIRTVLLRHGRAAAKVRLEPLAQESAGDVVRRRFRLEVAAGPAVRVGAVRFVGAERTQDVALMRAVDMRSGDLLDPTRLERDRISLSTLGMFRSVRVETVEEQPDVWDLVYHVKPGKRFQVAAHAGYGSYEQLRGGLEISQSDLFGRAHRARLEAVASMKSTNLDGSYVVPQVLGTPTDASLRAFAISREEVSFQRKEMGVSAGVRGSSSLLGAESSLRYNYKSLVAEPYDPASRAVVPSDDHVATLMLELVWNRLDSSINPRVGYLFGLSLETAARVIGSQLDFQRLDLRVAWHRQIGSETTVHVGLRHGALWSLNGADEELPVNLRFFPGGENTVRGYREGEAAPRAPDGTVIGAEVSTIVNVELEQGLTRQFSVVAFVDAGLSAERLEQFPGDETRVSAGLGLRYHSIIGPVRLEYGRNLVREPGDAADALHFSLGFPF
jgi:outer membrane protein insertion porin family